MSALSELLKQHQGDRSVRQIGRDCGQYGIGESTVIPYFNGKHGDNPPEEVLDALSRVMPLDIGRLREAAGVPRGESEPYSPPAEFNRLSHTQRTALDEFVRSFVGPQGATHAVPSDSSAPSRASDETGEDKEVTDRGTAVKAGLAPLVEGVKPSATPSDFVIPATDIVVELDANLSPQLEAATIDHTVIEAQHATTMALIDRVTALSPLKPDDDVDTAVAAFFLAVERYVAATEESLDAMQRVDLYATPQQIDVAIKAFDFFTTTSETFIPVLEDIAAKAPTVVLRKPAVRHGELLRDLVRRLENDKVAWIESGLSAVHAPSAQHHLMAARTAPRSYRPGQSEQGDAGGEEDQAHPSVDDAEPGEILDRLEAHTSAEAMGIDDRGHRRRERG